VEVGAHEAGRAAELAVPGVGVLVREEPREVAARPLFEECLLVRPVVARLVVLEAEVGGVVGEGEQPVIVAVVVAAEERLGLGD
jgi:ADP-ribose pyrophosphatase YjhB (NUDIX family)